MPYEVVEDFAMPEEGSLRVVLMNDLGHVVELVAYDSPAVPGAAFQGFDAQVVKEKADLDQYETRIKTAILQRYGQAELDRLLVAGKATRDSRKGQAVAMRRAPRTR